MPTYNLIDANDSDGEKIHRNTATMKLTSLLTSDLMAVFCSSHPFGGERQISEGTRELPPCELQGAVWLMRPLACWPSKWALDDAVMPHSMQ